MARAVDRDDTKLTHRMGIETYTPIELQLKWNEAYSEKGEDFFSQIDCCFINISIEFIYQLMCARLFRHSSDRNRKKNKND